jgi:hypothetical protein
MGKCDGVSAPGSWVIYANVRVRNSQKGQPYFKGGTFETWEAPVLPLNYTRRMVGDPGFSGGGMVVVSGEVQTASTICIDTVGGY